MSKSVFKKLIVGTAIASSPFLFPAVASANSAPIVNQDAVSLLTASLRDTVAAYDKLEAGHQAQARAKLSTAVRNLSTAVVKDPTLALSTTSGTSQSAASLHDQLKSLQSKMESRAASDVRSDLQQVLSSTGVL